MRRRTLLSLLFAASGFACSAPAEPEVGDEESAATASSNSPFFEVPVVALRVDEATEAWMAQQTSLIDGQLVGPGAARQRELYLRLQLAINAAPAAAAPILVHYGMHYADRDDARAVTDRFSKAVDASKVPVVLERNTALANADSALYHNWSLSNPPQMLVSESLQLGCTQGCRDLDVTLRTSNAALDSLPVAVRAGARMALGLSSKRSNARTDATDDLGARERVTFRVSASERKPRVTFLSLKDVLANESTRRSLAGAAVVVARDEPVAGTPFRYPELFAAVLADALRVAPAQYRFAPQG